MAFETFDLGKVLQVAQALDAGKRQATMDKLQMQYMGNQDARAATAANIANQGAQQQLDANTAKNRYLQANAIIESDNPHDNAKLFAPEFVQTYEQRHGQGSFDMASPEEIKQIAMSLKPHLAAAAGIQTPGAPTASQVGGFNVLQQDGKIIDSSAPKPANNPSSYDEYVLAQKDPEFASFLKSRKGKGISITNPDGSVIQIGGDGGAVSPAELSGPTKNKLQEAIVSSTDELDRLNSVGANFDPTFLQVPGRLKGAALKVKDIAGGMLGDMTPDERQYLDKFSTFKADAAKNLSTILNRLSGAAISPAEGERLKKGIPNDEDSPTQFIAKYRAAVKDSTRAIMRANWALKNGIGVDSVEKLSHTMPLGSIDHVYEQRANEIWQSLGGTPETKAQAIKQANGEFGLAK